MPRVGAIWRLLAAAAQVKPAAASHNDLLLSTERLYATSEGGEVGVGLCQRPSGEARNTHCTATCSLVRISIKTCCVTCDAR
jgi:hypothetical protein